MRGWGPRSSSENGAHPGMAQAGEKSYFTHLPWRKTVLCSLMKNALSLNKCRKIRREDQNFAGLWS
jgi:hypothetical protein